MGDPSAPNLEPEKLLEVLDRHAVDYVIVGGIAAVAHGASRVTFDVDVVPAWNSGNLSSLALALKEIDARLRVPGQDESVEFPLGAESLTKFEVSTWRTKFGDVDVIIGIPTARKGELAGFEDLVLRASRREVFGFSILIAGLDDIIESKQALSREPDLAALPELHRLRDKSAE